MAVSSVALQGADVLLIRSAILGFGKQGILLARRLVELNYAWCFQCPGSAAGRAVLGPTMLGCLVASCTQLHTHTCTRTHLEELFLKLL